MASSDLDICDFKEYGDYRFGKDSSYPQGSFSFKPTNLSDEIKCSKLAQTGF